MVSHLALIARNDQANARIDAAVKSIEAATGITLPPMPTDRHDREHAETLRLEWLAEVVGIVNGKRSRGGRK